MDSYLWIPPFYLSPEISDNAGSVITTVCVCVYCMSNITSMSIKIIQSEISPFGHLMKPTACFVLDSIHLLIYLLY